MIRFEVDVVLCSDVNLFFIFVQSTIRLFYFQFGLYICEWVLLTCNERIGLLFLNVFIVFFLRMFLICQNYLLLYDFWTLTFQVAL